MNAPTPMGEVPANAYMAADGEKAFVGITVLNVPSEMLDHYDAEKGMNGTRDGMLNNVGGKIVSEKRAKFVGRDALEVVGTATAEGLEVRVDARIFWSSPRMVSLFAISPQGGSTDMAQKFFDSFSMPEAE